MRRAPTSAAKTFSARAASRRARRRLFETAFLILRIRPRRTLAFGLALALTLAFGLALALTLAFAFAFALGAIAPRDARQEGAHVVFLVGRSGVAEPDPPLEANHGKGRSMMHGAPQPWLRTCPRA